MSIIDKLSKTKKAKQKMALEERRELEQQLRIEIKLDLAIAREKAEKVIRLERNAIRANYGNVDISSIGEENSVLAIRKAVYLMNLIDETEKLLNSLHVSEMLAEAINDYTAALGGLKHYSQKAEKTNDRKMQRLLGKVGKIESGVGERLKAAITTDMELVNKYADDEKVKHILEGENILELVRGTGNEVFRTSASYDILHNGGMTLEDANQVSGTVGGYQLM